VPRGIQEGRGEIQNFRVAKFIGPSQICQRTLETEWSNPVKKRVMNERNSGGQRRGSIRKIINRLTPFAQTAPTANASCALKNCRERRDLK